MWSVGFFSTALSSVPIVQGFSNCVLCLPSTEVFSIRLKVSSTCAEHVIDLLYSAVAIYCHFKDARSPSEIKRHKQEARPSRNLGQNKRMSWRRFFRRIWVSILPGKALKHRPFPDECGAQEGGCIQAELLQRLSAEFGRAVADRWEACRSPPSTARLCPHDARVSQNYYYSLSTMMLSSGHLSKSVCCDKRHLHTACKVILSRCCSQKETR
jgi:hypothetical protein